MAKITLGKRPANFKRTVKFQMLDGSEGAIECAFKYRTRTEFGQFIDGLFNAANEAKPADEKFSMADLMEKTKDKNAAYLLDVIDGWNLDEPLTRETAEQLCDELPAAATEIMETYRRAIVEGRLGN